MRAERQPRTLSVLVAVMLSVLSMAMLIVFIHHVAMLIQAPHVVAAVARDLDDAIAGLFPEEIGDAVRDEQRENDDGRDQAARLGENYLVVRSTRDGYIQAIDEDGLMQLARERDLLLRLHSRPGNFIAIGSPLADVWTCSEPSAEDSNAGDLTATLNETVIVGIRRTPRQDVECAIEELVEIAVRALSPGINDPFTAMNCIDRLGAALGDYLSESCPRRIAATTKAVCELSCALFPLPTHWTPLSTRSASTATTASRSRSVCLKPSLRSPNTFSATKTAML